MVVQMLITRDHPALIDQIFVENREFSYTPAFDAAINFNSLSRLDRTIQSVTDMLPLKRRWGFAQF